MKLTQTFIALIALGIVACGSSSKKNEASIKGKLSNSNNQQLYLSLLTPQGFKALDTCNIQADGSFEFDASIKEISFYKIGLTDQNYCLIIHEPGKKIYVEANAQNLNDLTKVDGSEDTKLLTSLSKESKVNYVKMDSIQKTFKLQATAENQVELQKRMFPEFEMYRLKQVGLAKDFIDKNTQSFASLSAIEMLDAEKDMPYFKKVDQALAKKYPTSEYVVMFHKRVADLSQLGMGSVAPEIILDTPEGKPLALSSFKGKVVLIDFWASWCRPCRAENPNVVKMYTKYHDKGFDIFSVSLDSDKGAWIKAIETDKLTWNHVSDLNQWNNAAAKTYQVTGIPMTYLLDKEGKIVAKGLRGAELEAKIAELLK